MTREAHLSDHHLADYAEGRMLAPDLEAAETHMSICAQCNRQAAAYRRLIDLMQTDRSHDAPEHVLNRAFRLLRTHRLTPAEPRPRRSFTALLRRDSARSGFALGVRGGPIPTRQLLFDIGNGNELEVRIEQSKAGWLVAGQILGACNRGQVVLEGVAGEASTELNELCEFSLPPHPGPVYKLVLRLDDVEVDVPILELRG